MNKLAIVVIIILAIAIAGFGVAFERAKKAALSPQPGPGTTGSLPGNNYGQNQNQNNPAAAKITYQNASANDIKVELPYPGAVVGKTFSVIGQARGPWYFEASFPVEVVDQNGNRLAQGAAQAQGEWTTNDFVPFKADLSVPQSYIGPATLILRNDNPSGLSQNARSISFPITIEY